MNIEKNLEDACLDLMVRKHVYNCSCIFKAADVGVRTCTKCTLYKCTVYMVESTGWEETGIAEMFSLVPSKQTAKTGVWFGEIERKLAKL